MDRLAFCALGLYVLGLGAIWHQRGTVEARAQDEPPIIQDQQAPPKVLTAPVSISFNTAKLDGELASVFSACSIPASAKGAMPPWKDWVTFEGKRLKTMSSETDVPVFAVRTSEGALLCAANHTDGPAQVRLSASLARGVYTVERMERIAGTESPFCAVERLQGAILGANGMMRKTGSLPATGVVVYRFINRTQQALTAFRAAKQRIKELRSGDSGAYRWLMTPFQECDSNVAVIARGISATNRDKALKHIHRAILTSSHAAALCRNFTEQGRIQKKAGEALAAKLDLLDEALSELSLACLGLAAETLVESESDGTVSVTVQLTNRGSRTINFVKIGALSLGGTKVSPGELATFGSVRPGETARALYRVRCANPDEFARIAAHVGYLAGKSPVRLRLRPAI